MCGLLKRKTLLKSDLDRFYSVIILIHRFLSQTHSSSYKNFETLVKKELKEFRKVQFKISSFQRFLFHLKHDLGVSQQILFAIIHRTPVTKVLTNHFQFKNIPSLSALTKCPENVLYDREGIYPNKTLIIPHESIPVQIAPISQLPLEILLIIGKYLSSSEKIAFMLTCRRFFLIGSTLLKIEFNNWQDLVYRPRPFCPHLKAVKEPMFDFYGCKCLLCIGFCPCEENPIADFDSLKRFTLRNVVFHKVNLDSEYEFQLFLRHIYYVPTSLNILFPLKLHQLRKLYRACDQFKSLKYFVDTTQSLQVKEVELSSFLKFPACKALEICFSPLDDSYTENDTLPVAVLKGHLQQFKTRNSNKLEFLSLTNCTFIDKVFQARLFTETYTWFESITVLEIFGAKMSCQLLRFLPRMKQLHTFYLCDIQVEQNCAPEHFNRHLRSDFYNMQPEYTDNFDLLHHKLQRFPPLKIYSDLGLLCSCIDINISREDFEQYRNVPIAISTCYNCTLIFGCHS